MIQATVSSTGSTGIIKQEREWILEATDKKVSSAKKGMKDAMDKKEAISVVLQNHHELDMKKLKIAEESEIDQRNLFESYPPVLWCPTGTNIFDYYDLRQELGSGGYATTHLCIEKATRIKYACKIIEKSKLITKEDRKKVRSEISMMAHLRGHRNIIELVGSYEDSQKVYLVMELCQGGELFEQMDNIGSYTEEEAAAIIKDIMQAVKYCHEHYIIHRDLKPENILFSSYKKTATLKVIDFGLSTYFKPGQKFDNLVGTSCYMAPEVITGQHGKEVDIWSVGVILYSLLTGDYPFSGETDFEIAEATINQEINYDGEIWNDISLEAKDLLKGMLNRDIQNRLTAQQVLDHPWFLKQEAPQFFLIGSRKYQIMGSSLKTHSF